MATTITAGNATNGAAISSDNTGILELKSGTGSGTTAVTVSTGQNVTFAQAANLPNTFGFKNRIINGAMVIDQRNNGASVTVNSTTATYPVDRWFGRGVATAGVFTLQQISDAPAGFRNSIRATVTTTAASPGATDFYGIQHRIEGFNISDVGYGTANAQSVTVSFWVKSSVTGTFSVALSNNNDQTIPVTFSVSAANTWEQKSITIAGTSSGTWDSTNGTGLLVQFTLGAGSSRTGTANTWSSSFFVNATGATNLMATNLATFQITGVQLEKGSTATSFDYRPYGTELQLCQRYYWRWLPGSTLSAGLTGVCSDGSYLFVNLTNPVVMRSSPSAGSSSPTGVTSLPSGNQYSIYLGGYKTTSWANFVTSNAYNNILRFNVTSISSGQSATVDVGASVYFDFSSEL